MRLLILSDLHREFWEKRQVSFDLACLSPDVVVLAGDIDTGDARSIQWAQAAGCAVQLSAFSQHADK
ncbi:hypothetical protein [Pseudoduganella sp. HUAS MS19]